MKLWFEGCAGLTGYEFFRDIAKYENLIAYAEAVAKCIKEGKTYEGRSDNDIPEFVPLQFYIYHGDSSIAVNDSGRIPDTLKEDLRQLEEEVGSRCLEFDSPIMEIKAEIFEHNLYAALL